MNNVSLRTVIFTALLILTIIPVTWSQNTIVVDTLSSSDTLLIRTIDTVPVADTSKIRKNVLDKKVIYSAKDSIRFEVKEQIVFQYNNAVVKYDKLTLEANFIEADFKKNLVYATFTLDSTEKEIGLPVFTENDQKFESREMRYNYTTKKGKIRNVFTKEGDGYLHGKLIKKMSNDIINIKDGAYTTCDQKDPHFGFRFSKSQLVPNNKIVTGPAYLVIEDVPTPLVIPFGLFPIKKGQHSGIIFPSINESVNRGFFFENGGYYFSISDKMDLAITGDLYTRGSWAVRPYLRYAKRYRYTGNFDFKYAINIEGDKGSVDYKKNKDFSIRWVHSQDAKAHPTRRFSANVNIVTRKFNNYNLASTNDYLSNTFQSSISYQKSWAGKYFLTANFNHSQNTIDKSMSITLPQVTFNVNQFYPFRRKEPVGKLKWYENISIKYSTNAENRISTYDTLVFTPGWEKGFQNGMKHNIPISTSAKVLKFFNWSIGGNYNERWYLQTIRKNWVDTSDTTGYVKTDTVDGFSAARDFDFSTGLSTKMYGMYTFSKGPVTAIRHVISPSVSFSMRPDFGKENWGYYKTYQSDTAGNISRYSIYEGSLYNGPSDGQSGRIGFTITNNLEMKVKSKKDTITGTKKIVLIDNLTLTTGYDLAKDSLRWSKLSISGRTVLFKKLNINFSSTLDPYILDSSGTKNLNQFEWDVNRRLLRLDRTSWSFSIDYRLSSKPPQKKAPAPGLAEEDREYINRNLDQFIDWENPWSLNFSYSFSYSNTFKYIDGVKNKTQDLVQSLRLSGDISLTSKWKIGFTSGYDFKASKITYTTVDIYRDLHCWEMRMSWVPMGERKSWNFILNVKSTLLKDLKLTKKKDFRDF